MFKVHEVLKNGKPQANLVQNGLITWFTKVNDYYDPDQNTYDFIKGYLQIEIDGDLITVFKTIKLESYLLVESICSNNFHLIYGYIFALAEEIITYFESTYDPEIRSKVSADFAAAYLINKCFYRPTKFLGDQLVHLKNLDPSYMLSINKYKRPEVVTQDYEDIDLRIPKEFMLNKPDSYFEIMESKGQKFHEMPLVVIVDSSYEPCSSKRDTRVAWLTGYPYIEVHSNDNRPASIEWISDKAFKIDKT